MIHPIFMYYNQHTRKYIVVKSSNHDYSQINSAWMGDKDLGKRALIPSLDIMESKESFDSEQAALTRVAQLYSEQLEKQ